MGGKIKNETRVSKCGVRVVLSVGYLSLCEEEIRDIMDKSFLCQRDAVRWTEMHVLL